MGTSENNSQSTWEKIQTGVRDTERLLGQKKYNLAMIRARQTLEFMVKSMCDRAGIMEGGLIDMGVEQGFVRKSGAWYTYEGDQLGQGKENARNFLRDNPQLTDELELKIKRKLGILADPDAEDAAGVLDPDAPIDAEVAVDF